MSKKSYFTKEGLQKLKDDLHHLVSVERPSLSRQIAEARDKGDLSENAEYHAAKEAQGLLEMKISKLEDVLFSARIVDKTQLNASKVSILSNVKIKHLNMGKEQRFTIVAENEADISAGKISIDSPIGRGLLGKEVGEIAEIKVPNGVIKLEILEISL